MAEPFATVAELKIHWPAMPADLTDAEALQKLVEASIEIRGNFPGIDERVRAGTLDLDTVKLVANRMAKRALDVSDQDRAGVSQQTAQAGPLAFTQQFTNPDGNMYLTKADRRLLNPQKIGGGAFSTFPGGVGRAKPSPRLS